MTPAGRHYGLDWLRIAAFTLLIPYHVALAFSPWHWIVSSGHVYPALVAPMAALTPWRLGLLFAVSGYAGAMLFARAGDATAFAGERSRRLLIPLAFAMVAVVPLEMWVRVREAGYARDYLHFRLFDAWTSGTHWGVKFPSWEHLWFLVYLWAYTMIVAGLTASRRALAWLDRAATCLAVGHRLLWAPMAATVAARLALLFVIPERQGLFRDWAGHSQFLTLFVLGFLIARHPPLWRALHRCWRPAALLALLGGGAAIAVEVAYPGTAVPPHALMAVSRAGRSVMAWGMVVTLFHLADAHANRDHRWRRSLGQAVFPAYIVHHPAIVLATWCTLPLALAPGVQAAVILTATIAACGATVALARLVPIFGILVGVAAPIKRQGGTAPAIC
ncbi:acyltransferase family protein [Sphingomonas sp. SAFR-052]|uniref:acyltransferase family protein n=1 Tax=Sphingomonas sp. SAFR-052 TaxID=3436867 RepID=UPI003F7D49A4